MSLLRCKVVFDQDFSGSQTKHFHPPPYYCHLSPTIACYCQLLPTIANILWPTWELKLTGTIVWEIYNLLFAGKIDYSISHRTFQESPFSTQHIDIFKLLK